jgi:hypothetical protein
VENLKTLDAADWKLDERGRPGIWVARKFIVDDAMPKISGSKWRPLTNDDLGAIYAGPSEAAE